MHRREFSAGAAGMVAAALGLPGLAQAQFRFQEGKDFRALEVPVPSEAGAGKIEVIEFFWYSCPHCNAFEPHLVSWIQRAPSHVAVRRVPVAFRDDFVPQQRLFYVLDAMGRLDLHPRVFEAIHVHRQPLRTQGDILGWAEKQGLDAARFRALYNSSEVSTRARRAVQLQDAYAVEGVPALGIGGRFYTDGTLAGGVERVLQVADFLVARAR